MLLPSPHSLLHDPHPREAWKCIWLVLASMVGVAALTPGELAPGVTASDKVDHLLAFSALSATGLLALAPGRGNTLLTGASMLAYGVLIELLQTKVPGRCGDMQDALADAVGVALGIGMVIGLRWTVRAQTR